MARQKGITKLTGKIGDLSFYKSKDGYLAREKGGIEAERIKNDPAFIRTRENGAEFGSSASSGKLLRDSIRTMMQNASDSRVTGRLMKVMTQIKNMDATNARGERSVGVGIVLPAAKALLKGFNFNNRAILGSVLFKSYTVAPLTGAIAIQGFVPINDLNTPSRATHVTLKSAWAKVDFTSAVSVMEESNIVNLPIDGTLTTVTLIPATAPIGTGTDVYLLMLEFFQEVNGVQYTLKNGAFNVLSIVEIL
mgnify:CR=1 FL=1